MVAAMRDAAMSSGGVSPGYAELLRQYAYHAGPGRVERHYREHQHAKNLLHRHRAPPNRSNQNAAFRIGGSAPAHRKAPGLRPELIAQRTNPSYPLGKGAGPPIPERKPEPRVAALLGDDVQIDRLASQSLAGGPAFLRKIALSWSDKVLSN